MASVSSPEPHRFVLRSLDIFVGYWRGLYGLFIRTTNSCVWLYMHRAHSDLFLWQIILLLSISIKLETLNPSTVTEELSHKTLRDVFKNFTLLIWCVSIPSIFEFLQETAKSAPQAPKMRYWGNGNVTKDDWSRKILVITKWVNLETESAACSRISGFIFIADFF